MRNPPRATKGEIVTLLCPVGFRLKELGRFEMNLWTVVLWSAGILGATIALYGLHRLALYLEREGWIRYIKNPPSADAGAGAAFGELQQIFEPQTKHVYEMKEKKRPIREADGGEPDTPKD